MNKTHKAEIKKSVQDALAEIIQHLKIKKPSRKTRKAISKVVKALRSDLKSEMKKLRKNARHSTPSRKAKGAAATQIS